MNDRDQHSDDPLDPTILPETPTAALDAGLAAAFAEDESIELRSCHTSVLKSLGQNLRNVPRVVLRTAIGEGSSPIVRPRSKQMPAAGDPDSRYRLDGEIARGGMGAILKGRDTDLGRDLAIKVLLDSHKDKPDVVERFVEEAQIGGQLQHPGIVPVYELGQFEDERPFFSMKLVKGKTLSALLAERELPTDDRARFLGIFEQICQTMAYAHSRAVIHRDLKPANIMVGAFGEVQVMDWGLAKVLGEGGVADERKAISSQQGTSIIETIRSHGTNTPGVVGSQTQLGSVLGTPAYMSPEQALGEVDRLDERADVFGLGAILCEILTGKPPYVSDDGTEVFRMATRGKLENCFDRLSESGADEELIGLVRCCLELEPADRPRDAGVVNNRLTEYLESVEQRLHQAELDRLEANTRAVEETKRRRVTLALATSVLLTCGIVVGGWVHLDKAKRASENESIRQKEKLNGQVRSELSAARAMAGDLLPETKTDPQLLARALESVRRAESLLKSGEVDPLLSKQVSKLRTALERRKRDEKLVAALEDTWEWEMEQLAEHAIAIRAVMNSYRPPADDDGNPLDGEYLPPPAIKIPGVFEVAGRYETAFADWGIEPETTPKANAVRSLRALAPSKSALALVSLDRWHRALTTNRRFEDWEGTSWSILEPIELTSRGGDKLDVLDDKSILASGDNPSFGYDMVFETDQQTISAFRLETLLHDSLPASGPGRDPRGGFYYLGLQIEIAPRSTPDKLDRVHLRSAVADHTNPAGRIGTGHWDAMGGGGTPHLAVFDVEKPIHSESGFRVTISTRDKEQKTGSYAESNLGRFRWSTTSDSSEPTARWLSDVVNKVDDNPWR